MGFSYKNRLDLSDDLIGEAVIVLLKTGGAITISALLDQLSEMATASQDADRKEACLQSISDVKLSIGRYFNQRREHLEKQSVLLNNSLSSRYQENDTKH